MMDAQQCSNGRTAAQMDASSAQMDAQQCTNGSTTVRK